MALSENKIIIPYNSAYEIALSAGGDVSTHILHLHPYSMDIEGITDPSSWDWSLEIGKLFPERVEKSFFGLITKVIPAHIGLTAEDHSSASHIYRPSGDVTFTCPGVPEFIINFGELYPEKEYPINLIIKAKKVLPAGPVQINFYEKLTFMMEKQKVTSSSGWVPYVNPWAGAASSATNETCTIKFVENGEFTSTVIVGAKYDEPFDALYDFRNDSLLNLKDGVDDDFINTSLFGNDLDSRYLYSKKNPDEYYDEGITIGLIHLFEDNDFDFEEITQESLSSKKKDALAGIGALKYDSNAAATAGNVAPFAVRQIENGASGYPVTKIFKIPGQFLETPGRKASRGMSITQIAREQANNASSVSEGAIEAISKINTSSALDMGISAVTTWNNMLQNALHPLETPNLIETLGKWTSGDVPQTITIENSAWDNQDEFLAIGVQPTEIVIPGGTGDNKIIGVKITPVTEVHLNALAPVLGKLNMKDRNSFLDFLYACDIDTRTWTEYVWINAAGREVPVNDKYGTLGARQVNSANWNLSPPIREELIKEWKRMSGDTLSGAKATNQYLTRYEKQGIHVTGTESQTEIQRTVTEKRTWSMNAAALANQAFLNESPVSFDRLRFSLSDNNGKLHKLSEVDAAVRFESRLDPDAVRLELKMGGLDDSLMQVKEGGIFYEYVPMKDTRLTIGASKGQTDINGQPTEKKNGLHAKIETRDLFFQLDYLKSHRDNGTMNEYRATLHKKLTNNITYGLDALYFSGKTDVHYSDDGKSVAEDLFLGWGLLWRW